MHDIHEWEGGRCDFYPLRVCTCRKCDDKEQIKCEGKPYKTTMKLDSKIRSHLATCLENSRVSRFPILGDQEKSQRQWSSTVHVACQKCRMPEEEGDEMAMCDSCHVWYCRHCMDIPSEVFDEDSEVHWECKRCVQSHTQASATGEKTQSQSKP